MRKFLYAVLLVVLLSNIANAIIPAKYTIENNYPKKYFKSTNWWLKEHKDIIFNSCYYYTPLKCDKLFSGIYYRFHRNKLVMVDRVVKKGVTNQAIIDFMKTMGKTKNMQGVLAVSGIGYYKGVIEKNGKNIKASIKTEQTAFYVKGQKLRRVVFVPDSYYLQGNAKLLRAHVEASNNEEKFKGKKK